jgi:hypothetical protein
MAGASPAIAFIEFKLELLINMVNLAIKIAYTSFIDESFSTHCKCTVKTELTLS